MRKRNRRRLRRLFRPMPRGSLKRVPPPLHVEFLEERAVPAILFDAFLGVVHVAGTPYADTVHVRMRDAYDLSVGFNGNTEFFPIAFVFRLHIRAEAGNDLISISHDVLVDAFISGGQGDDQIDSGGGNDVIHGDDGNDQIDAGPGNDVVAGGAGDDTIGGGEGDDRISGDDSSNTSADAGASPSTPADPQAGGNDSLTGGDGNDSISGGAGDDVIVGGDGDDLLEGDAGDDSINGGAGDDQLDGGEGDDVLVGGPGYDQIDGGAGNDRVHDEPASPTVRLAEPTSRRSEIPDDAQELAAIAVAEVAYDSLGLPTTLALPAEQLAVHDWVLESLDEPTQTHNPIENRILEAVSQSSNLPYGEDQAPEELSDPPSGFVPIEMSSELPHEDRVTFDAAAPQALSAVNKTRKIVLRPTGLPNSKPAVTPR